MTGGLNVDVAGRERVGMAGRVDGGEVTGEGKGGGVSGRVKVCVAGRERVGMAGRGKIDMDDGNKVGVTVGGEVGMGSGETVGVACITGGMSNEGASLP